MKKRQRLHFILFVLACLSASAGLSLYALRDNISLFFTPSEMERKVAPGQRFRLGGLVKKSSLQKRDENLSVAFAVTDGVKDVRVEYKGILPDLFREGQGVIATGALNDKGVFIASELLAKHDEKYMPPEVARSLQRAENKKSLEKAAKERNK